jgi:hypothetical protein
MNGNLKKIKHLLKLLFVHKKAIIECYVFRFR